MSPTFRHGKNTALYLDVTDLSPFLNSVTFTAQVDTAETSAFGSTGKTYVTGLDGGTLSMAGMFSGLAGDIEPVLTAALGTSTDNNVTACYDGGAPAVGRRCGLVAMIESQFQVTAPITGMVAIQGDGQVDGGLDFGALLSIPSVPITAATNGTGVDFTSTTSVGAVANLHVLTNTAGQNLSVKIQDSADNSTFADISTPMAFATVTAGTTSSQRVATLISIRRYVRFVAAGVTTGSVAMVVSFAKR